MFGVEVSNVNPALARAREDSFTPSPAIILAKSGEDSVSKSAGTEKSVTAGATGPI